MDPQNLPNTSRIAYWNADGLQTKRHEIEEFIVRYKLDVLLTQETFLKPSHTFNIPNYICYRRDRLHGDKGGTAIFIHKSTQHSEMQHEIFTSLEANTIAINLSNNKILKITSVYQRPSKDLLSDIQKLLNFPHPTIAAGDYNSKHPAWNSSMTNHRGSY